MERGVIMQNIIRIGSRESRLAVIQAEIIRKQIQNACPEVRIELVTMKTSGDKILDRSLEAIGGKGLFVKELDRALLDGKIDIAVHSLKDMPMETNENLPILAFGRRGDPRDALIIKPGKHTFPQNGVIGTSSRRRMLQMKELYPDCSFRGIRGNVQTRLGKLETEEYDGTILAAAGLKRLGMEHVISRIFEPEEMVPAAGQGILAVQGRKGASFSWLETLKNRDSEIAARAERQFVRALDGGCTSPTAAYAAVRGNEIRLTGFYQDETTGETRRDTITGESERAQCLGEKLALRIFGGK